LFTREQYFPLFPIIWFIIFLLFLGFSFLFWFGCWFLILVVCISFELGLLSLGGLLQISQWTTYLFHQLIELVNACRTDTETCWWLFRVAILRAYFHKGVDDVKKYCHASDVNWYSLRMATLRETCCSKSCMC
jgi:hypothetical protein